MSRNPKTVLKAAAALKAELAKTKTERDKLSKALGVMQHQAEVAGREAERLRDQRNAGQPGW